MALGEVNVEYYDGYVRFYIKWGEHFTRRVCGVVFLLYLLLEVSCGVQKDENENRFILKFCGTFCNCRYTKYCLILYTIAFGFTLFNVITRNNQEY